MNFRYVSNCSKYNIITTTNKNVEMEDVNPDLDADKESRMCKKS